jgi:ribosomal protein S18 acetylase RimI-like enzyme
VNRTKTFEIRPATAEDVPVLIELARRSWLSAFESIVPDAMIDWWKRANREPVWYQRYWPSMHVAAPSNSLGIEATITLVGVVQPVWTEVNGLWIHPDFQGLGVGTRLLTLAETIIGAAGHTQVWLTCSGFNRRARDFYERRGYHVSATTLQIHPSGVPEEI